MIFIAIFDKPMFDSLFQYQMKVTLDEDVDIINYIYDDYVKGFMSNKFDITQTKYRQKMKKLMEYAYLDLHDGDD